MKITIENNTKNIRIKVPKLKMKIKMRIKT